MHSALATTHAMLSTARVPLIYSHMTAMRQIGALAAQRQAVIELPAPTRAIGTPVIPATSIRLRAPLRGAQVPF